ncbi:hypothetical protein ABZP36_014139 [Zizania latifolia]
MRCDRHTLRLTYCLLGRHHSDPQRLAATLSESGLDSSSPLLLDAVLRRCGAASSLALHFFHWCTPSLPVPLLSSLALLAKSFSRASSAPSLSLLAPLPSQLLSPSLLSPILRRFSPPRLLPFTLSLLSARHDHDHPSLFLSLLESLTKTGHVAAAEQLIEELQPRLPLTLRHYTALLYWWCRQGKLDEAKHVLTRMKAVGVAPDVVVFNTLLAGFIADGRFEDAFELTREMEQHGCPPNAVSYTILMQGLGVRGRVDEAMRVFVEMRGKGCFPDAVTYATLVTSFCKAGRISQEYEFLDTMVRECRCPPDLSIYNVVIRSSCKLGEMKQAMALWLVACWLTSPPSCAPFLLLVKRKAEEAETKKNSLTAPGPRAVPPPKLILTRRIMFVPLADSIKECLPSVDLWKNNWIAYRKSKAEKEQPTLKKENSPVDANKQKQGELSQDKSTGVDQKEDDTVTWDQLIMEILRT